MTQIDRKALIRQLRSAVTQYEARACPSPQDTLEYEEALQLLAELTSRQEALSDKFTWQSGDIRKVG